MQFKKTLATATVLGFQLVQAEVYIITPGLPAATATPSFKNKDEVTAPPLLSKPILYMLI
jgi:hypothetical protein